MVSKEPNCLPTANSHTNGNLPEKSATMTVRSVLLNRNSPDIESRLKRRRNRTHQVRFKDLDDGDGLPVKPDRRSPHPARKSPSCSLTSSWRDEVANGPSLVGSVRGDMESTIGAVEELLKRAPRHPLTPGPTRRSWASPRPCSLTLPLPRQPCMSTAIQTSPSLQKPLGIPRSQSLGSSIRADWDEDEDEEDLLVGIVTPISPCDEGGSTPDLEAADSTMRRPRDDPSKCRCSGEVSAPSSDLLRGQLCSCHVVAPKSIPGRYRGRRRRITRAASDPGRADSPVAVSPARAVSPNDCLPAESPVQKSPVKSSVTQTDPPSPPASPEKASCAQQTEDCISQKTVLTNILPSTPISHNTPDLSLPISSSSSQNPHSSPKAVLPVNKNIVDSSTFTSPDPTLMMPAQVIPSVSETLPHGTNQTQTVPSCKAPQKPVPCCQTPTQSGKVKTPTQNVPSPIPVAKSTAPAPNHTDTALTTQPSVALTQPMPVCETPKQTPFATQIMSSSAPTPTPTNVMPTCFIPESAVPPYVTQQTIQVCSSSPFKIIAPGILPNQTSSPNICIRQVALSQTVTATASVAHPACPAAYLHHAAPPYGSSPRASPAASSQAPSYTTQDRKLPPPPPPPPPYTPRKEGATATGQTRRPQTPKPVSTEKEKDKAKPKEKVVGNGVAGQHMAADGHICRKKSVCGAEGGAAVAGVPACTVPKNSAQAAIKAATMGARRALFSSCSEAGQACGSQCPRPRTPCGQQQSSSAQAEGQADALRHVQELLGGLMSGARCKLDLNKAREKLLGPNGPLYDIGTLQTQLHSLEGVLETSQNTIKVLLDVIQDLEKKEAERDGRHSYRTGQDIENCGTCRDCACIIYSVEHDFRQQEGQVTRAWRVPEHQECEHHQGSPQTPQPAPPRNQESPQQAVKKSRKKCFWFL
ncbi:mucin-2 [Engraulis encrasicolus]|uniref:mucin-2 n=1 Tax=Engraulis encrasicolus TaxID=184585 RepID=UPI002FD15414